ncbi:MAG TPA: cysteine methyltransferase, partial [Alteromonas macleodii]|nr:cysteine methyltransferase [Alteromonas macleodii]
MKYTDFVNSIQGLVKVEATDKGITAIEFVSAAESDNTANAKQG